MEDNKRFTFVEFFDKKTGGPDPDDFGFIYRDQQTDKEYLVDHLDVTVWGVPHYTLCDISEIVSRPPNNTYMSEKEFAEQVVLNDSPTQAIEDFVTQLRNESEQAGDMFRDFRSRKLDGRVLPRFEPVEGYRQIDENDPDCKDYGYFYYDNVSGREFLVMEDYPFEGKTYAVRSIDEVVSRPIKTIMHSIYTRRSELELKDAPLDAQEALIEYLSGLCKNRGGIFEDLRTRKTQSPIPFKNSPKPQP